MSNLTWHIFGIDTLSDFAYPEHIANDDRRHIHREHERYTVLLDMPTIFVYKDKRSGKIGAWIRRDMLCQP